MTEPRPAASLILLRGGAEFLMGLRGAGHRFMPNRLVFPGGAVDPGDAEAAAVDELAPPVLDRLARGASPALARALAHAAARELEEETGLSLGRPPSLAGFDYVCRAITPPGQPIRFDARFFVVDAGRAAGALAGSGELEGLRWYGVGEALALDLALVTREVIGQLQAWIAQPPETRAARTQTPVFREKLWSIE